MGAPRRQRRGAQTGVTLHYGRGIAMGGGAPSRPTLLSLLSVLQAVLVGCAGGVAPDQPRPSDGSSAASASPKVLVIGIGQEPPGFISQLVTGTLGVGGVSQIPPLVHSSLTVQNPLTFAYEPQLAAEQISIEHGTWRVNADGTMDTIWKLRPNVKWHDGTPFTADDLMFSLRVFKDREIPNAQTTVVARIDSATAPNPTTFAIHWSSVFVQADRAVGLTPLPRHILEETYETQKSNFVNSPRFSTEFVGLGPFQLARWESGVQIDFRAFDGYFLGRPLLDGITVRFLPDANTMVANILTGSVDMLFGIQSLELSAEVKQRWEGTNNRVLFVPSLGLFFLEIQFRPEHAGLANGFLNRSVRQALYHSLDRQAVVDVVTVGLAPMADSWISPSEPLRPMVEDAIPQFPLDVGRAQQLLAQAGWNRGSDGILVHQPSGERFETLVYGSAAEAKDLNVIVNGWKALGIEPKLYNIPPALEREREHRSTLGGAGIVQAPADAFYNDRLHSKLIPTAANNWTGSNRGGYINSRVDALLDRLIATIDPGQRVPLQRELLQEQMGDVALMPLYWRVGQALVRGDVRNATRPDTSNVHEWDLVRS
jgi:peptide/nickel transport system substrate-binding protein